MAEVNDNPEALPPFDDPRVQVAYRVLCEDPIPPSEEHWEGYVSRRIVAALAQQAATPSDAAEDALHFAICHAVSVANQSMDMARSEDGRRIRDILGRALYEYPATSRQAATPAPVEPFWYAVVSKSAPVVNRTVRRADLADEEAARLRETHPDVEVIPLYAAPPATPAAQPPTGLPIAWTITAPDGRQWYGERLTDAAVAARRDTATPAAQLAEGVVQRLMGLAMDLAHVYSFVGDNTMPRAKTALESALRAALAQAVPAGFRLVPVEPTEEMLAAAHEGDRQYTLRNFGDVMTVQQGPWDHWVAMIAAAPSATQEKPAAPSEGSQG